MRVKIRRTKNLDLVRKLNSQFFSEAPLSSDGLENSVWFVALDGDEPVGFAGSYVGIKGEVWLLRIAVARTHRRLGVGGRLLSVRLRHIKKHHPDCEMFTYVQCTNFASNRNLVKHDFTPYRIDIDSNKDEWLFFWRGPFNKQTDPV